MLSDNNYTTEILDLQGLEAQRLWLQELQKVPKSDIIYVLLAR